MVCINLTKDSVEQFRHFSFERLAVALALDLIVTSVTLLENEGVDLNDVFVSTDEDFNVMLHNHLEETGFSDIDYEFMLPNIYYILVTPNTVIACYNKELIQCNLS